MLFYSFVFRFIKECNIKINCIWFFRDWFFFLFKLSSFGAEPFLDMRKEEEEKELGEERNKQNSYSNSRRDIGIISFIFIHCRIFLETNTGFSWIDELMFQIGHFLVGSCTNHSPCTTSNHIWGCLFQSMIWPQWKYMYGKDRNYEHWSWHHT